MRFSRPKGHVGSMPRKWIDTNLPVCPFCNTKPSWEFGMKMGFLKMSRYHFRCTNLNCMIVLSIGVQDVMPGGLAAMNLVTLVTMSKSKTMIFEDPGNNASLKVNIGKKYTLQTLQNMCSSVPGNRYCHSCGQIATANENHCTSCGKVI